jgi:hypothetical protein
VQGSFSTTKYFLSQHLWIIKKAATGAALNVKNFNYIIHLLFDTRQQFYEKYRVHL